jgi:phospholipid-binding lipoprotein MlaA
MRITRMMYLLTFLFLVSCSQTFENSDPHEEFNRDMFELNVTLDKNILKPTAEGYQEITTEGVQKAVSNFLSNWKEPFYCLNYLARFEEEAAANSLFRFLINSIFGILGLFDIGEEMGLEKAETSHKDTLKKWEVPTGDYLVLPVFGSSSTRDAIAEPISWFADPVGYFIGFPYMLAKSILSMINERAENMELIDSTLSDSLDPYITVKSIYQQKYGEKSKEQEIE